MTQDILFTPHRIGGLELPNRIAMAPMTRSRAQAGDVVAPLTATYYAQRASAGLIISEGTQISPQGQGYLWTPGIYTAEQVAGWKSVTGAVHEAGGRIFAQLWHVGPISHSALNGLQPVGPMNEAAASQSFVMTEDGPAMVPTEQARALRPAELADIVDEYVAAARNAVAAGFDGVEIHAANGYLLDQFLRSETNRRTDAYGGSIGNRLRLLREVVEAVSAEIGADRVGVRISPFLDLNGCAEADDHSLFLAVAALLEKAGVAFLHTNEASPFDARDGQDPVPLSFREAMRAIYSGTIMVAGGYDGARARAILDKGLADVVAFGRPFIANPDLPRRLAENLPLAEVKDGPLYGGGAEGYTDYPAYDTVAA